MWVSARRLKGFGCVLFVFVALLKARTGDAFKVCWFVVFEFLPFNPKGTKIDVFG